MFRSAFKARRSSSVDTNIYIIFAYFFDFEIYLHFASVARQTVANSANISLVAMSPARSRK